MRVDLPKGIGLDSIMCALTVEIAKAQAKSTTFVVDIIFFFFFELQFLSIVTEISYCLRYHLVPDG